MAGPLEIYEMLCWDDDELLEHMGVLEEMKNVFLWREEDEEECAALIKFNGKFSLGFSFDKESNELYFIVNGRDFRIKGNDYRGRYEMEIQKICRYFGKRDKNFVNKLILPWVCKVLEIHFENVDLSDFLL
jgi:hypothetical protein